MSPLVITLLLCPWPHSSPSGKEFSPFLPLQKQMLTAGRKQKLTFANEGAEKAKQEAEVVARKRKVEDQAKWEGESIGIIPCPRPHSLPHPRRPVPGVGVGVSVSVSVARAKLACLTSSHRLVAAAISPYCVAVTPNPFPPLSSIMDKR
jgi:hypothetical protein